MISGSCAPRAFSPTEACQSRPARRSRCDPAARPTSSLTLEDIALVKSAHRRRSRGVMPRRRRRCQSSSAYCPRFGGGARIHGARCPRALSDASSAWRRIASRSPSRRGRAMPVGRRMRAARRIADHRPRGRTIAGRVLLGRAYQPAHHLPLGAEARFRAPRGTLRRR